VCKVHIINLNFLFQIQRFRVAELHRCMITSLTWSNNGMKLFSGDAAGTVALTDIDFEMVIQFLGLEI
jgi:WD40 repeat protein